MKNKYFEIGKKILDIIPKSILLIILYLTLRDISIPYVNLLFTLETRFTIVVFVAIMLYRPKPNIIVTAIMVLFVLYTFLYIFIGEKEIEVFGIIVFLLLSIYAIKLFRRINR